MKSPPALQAQWKGGVTSWLGKQRLALTICRMHRTREKVSVLIHLRRSALPQHSLWGALTEAVYSGGDSTWGEPFGETLHFAAHRQLTPPVRYTLDLHAAVS
jgi:hypothetical protein